MKDSKIEWCDHTFNPWEGCTKVSPGCANCYAEARNKRWAGGANWGKGAPRRRTSEANWRQPLKWDREAEKAYLSAAHSTGAGERIKFIRPRVFCASLADWLDDEVPIEWLAELLALIKDTPYLDWLLLTKRPENWRSRLAEMLRMRVSEGSRGVDQCSGIALAALWLNGGAPANAWIGTTVEDQKRADERIPVLLSIPARVRFLSCEPLLGPVNLERVEFGPRPNHTPQSCLTPTWMGRFDAKINWVICGGESGHGARPMHPDWARSLRDQCQAAGVPFFFKQWGEWAPGRSRDEYTERDPLRCMKTSGELSWWAGNDDTTTNYSKNYQETDQPIERVGKAAAGRLLHGREHNEFPEVRP